MSAPPAGTNAKASTAAAAAVAGVGAIPSLLAAVAAVSVGAHAIGAEKGWGRTATRLA